MNKNTIYISFYDESTKKIVPEYIPGEVSHTKNWLKNKQYKLILRLGMEVYYWNLRHLLTVEMRKTEDLLFIIHVLEEHADRPLARRERMFYSKMLSLYGAEIETLIKPFIAERKDKDAIIHPYYLAYKKRWLRPKNSQARRFYHGLDRNELDIMFESLINRMDTETKSRKLKKSYYKKLLKKQ